MKITSIAPSKKSPSDDCESAKILMNEGLADEAKKLLFRVLANHSNYGPAKKLLEEIEEIELKEIFNSSGRNSTTNELGVEDVDQLITRLEQDLNLNSVAHNSSTDEQTIFNSTAGLRPKEYLDLAIGYIEMGCHADALRELHKAERIIRTEDTFLGETGLTVVSLIAKCLVSQGKHYEAKEFLQPILTETDLAHENKIILYYEMGCIEQALGNKNEAVQWLLHVMKIDSLFKDTNYRLKLLTNKK